MPKNTCLRMSNFRSYFQRFRRASQLLIRWKMILRTWYYCVLRLHRLSWYARQRALISTRLRSRCQTHCMVQVLCESRDSSTEQRKDHSQLNSLRLESSDRTFAMIEHKMTEIICSKRTSSHGNRVRGGVSRTGLCQAAVQSIRQ